MIRRPPRSTLFPYRRSSDLYQLDACEVCGPTGYYERDDQVVCKLCDVIMNKATIGMPGGCNPVPVKYDVDSGTIRIEQSILEKEAKRFR